MKPLQTIILMLMLTQVMLGQHAQANFARELQAKVTVYDTIIYLNIPERPANALEGSAFASQVWNSSIIDREIAVVNEILSGNVPSFSRKLKAIRFIKTIAGTSYEMIFYTACDYMAIGSDQDYFYIPMTPSTAQYLADSLNCTLPTKKMVDVIYNRAEFKLSPQPIPPSSAMTTVPVFWQHTDSIKQQFAQLGFDRSADNIVGGTKKDIIISYKIYSPDRNYERVVIYGWHLSVNNPIQPVYNGHIAMYADYSHGVRLISNTAFLNGDPVQVKDIVADVGLWPLLSDEGIISQPWYPPSGYLTSLEDRSENLPVDFQLYQNYPNPFNPKTTIEYKLSKNSVVNLSIYDLTGRKVVTLISETQPAGYYAVEWDAQAYSSGMYIATLKAGFVEQHRKMILLR
ncbi:MAG: T9SS type A sorting domain-containing protein [Calditrichaeota bacterium]|nr:T9SS type A sorting domain-containing protein [Calditrichota bacterium]